MIAFSHRKTKTGRGLVLLALCGFLTIAQPRQAFATGAMLTFDASQFANMMVALGNDLIKFDNMIDTHFTNIKAELQKRLEGKKQQALMNGGFQFMGDVMKYQGPTNLSASHTASMTSSDMSRKCAMAKARYNALQMEAFARSMGGATAALFLQGGTMQNGKLSYQVAKTPPDLARYCMQTGKNFTFRPGTFSNVSAQASPICQGLWTPGATTP